MLQEIVKKEDIKASHLALTPSISAYRSTIETILTQFITHYFVKSLNEYILGADFLLF